MGKVVFFFFLGFVLARVRRNALELPGPGWWDLGPPRMVYILSSTAPPLIGERSRAHYRFLGSELSSGPGGLLKLTKTFWTTTTFVCQLIARGLVSESYV